ncbi:MAG TPA: hypothetical protein VGD10_01360 [Allosphingosinicella sp.]
MSRRAALLLPLAALPLLLLGLRLWRDQGAMIWLSGFIAYCL